MYINYTSIFKNWFTQRAYPPEKWLSPHKRMVLRVFVMDIIYKNFLYVYLKSLSIRKKNIICMCVSMCLYLYMCGYAHIQLKFLTHFI